MLLTPGLYRQPVAPVRPVGSLARGDIAVLIGYCRKGPAGVPVRLHSLGEFEDLFGAAIDHGFLWHSVKGFFENGGRTAYVLRIISQRTRAARCTRINPVLPDGLRIGWRATASFPWLAIDPRKLTSALTGESAAWIQIFEQVLRDGGVRTNDPGAFGNSLVLNVARTSLVRTETSDEVIDGGNASSVRSLSGLETGSILELTQTDKDGATRLAIRTPAGVDMARQRIVWSASLADAGLDPRRPIRVTSVEFDLNVFSDGKLQQSFAALSPNPSHSRSMTKVLPASCRAIDFSPAVFSANGIDERPAIAAQAGLGAVSWDDPLVWPQTGDYPLTGGLDGLEEITQVDWLSAFPAIQRLSDAAMLVAPDIVLPESALLPVSPSPAAFLDCCVLDVAEAGFLLGKVVSFDSDGREVPLGGVAVDVAGPGGVAATGSDGLFRVSDIGLSLVSIRLNKPGYEPLEFQAQPSPFMPSQPIVMSMAPLTTPRVFVADEIIALQSALANPEIVGAYKIALIDPPFGDMRADQLASWRARLGDSARMGFFAPWINLPSPGRGDGTVSLACPPSGHVAGAFAAAEVATGIHRTGANLQLRYVEGVTLHIDDATQGGLNPIGINAIRAFPGRGVRIFGTRSLSSDPEWRYLTTRRIVDAIEKSMERALQWMVFEPNNLITRHSVQTTASILLDRLFRQGILSGVRADGAYSAKCDDENNPDSSRDDGKLVVDIAVAPTQPFEFIYFRLGHEFDAIQVTER
ncbi:MAG: phage tail sheath family protein [Allorhizobium sp.]